MDPVIAMAFGASLVVMVLYFVTIATHSRPKVRCQDCPHPYFCDEYDVDCGHAKVRAHFLTVDPPGRHEYVEVRAGEMGDER